MELTYLFTAQGVQITDLEVMHAKKVNEDGKQVVQV